MWNNLPVMSHARTAPPRYAALLGLALATVVSLAGCTTPSTSTAPVVSLAVARAAVARHWDLNRQALRASSGAEARRLIREVEGGDALRMDEAVIVREADARSADHSSPPTIPDAANVRVFVPRQFNYPASFISIRTQALTNAAGALTGKTDEVLEYFQQAATGASWRNVAYSDIAPGMADNLEIAVDADGFAAFADGPPGSSQLSSLYSEYFQAVLAGRPGQASKRVAPGALTDQFARDLKTSLGKIPNLKRSVTFTAASHQEGIKLKTRTGGRFILFSNLYDVLTTSADGGCVTAGPGSTIPGAHASVTDHYLQDVAALVSPGAEGTVAVVAEADSAVSVDSRPCSGGATI